MPIFGIPNGNLLVVFDFFWTWTGTEKTSIQWTYRFQRSPLQAIIQSLIRLRRLEGAWLRIASVGVWGATKISRKKLGGRKTQVEWFIVVYIYIYIYIHDLYITSKSQSSHHQDDMKHFLGLGDLQLPLLRREDDPRHTLINPYKLCIFLEISAHQHVI